MQVINRKSVAYDSLPTNVNDTALKRQFLSGPFSRVITLQAMNKMFAAFHISFPAYTQILLTPVPIHPALSGGPGDYIAQRKLEPSLSSSQFSHVWRFVKQSCCFRSIRMRGKTGMLLYETNPSFAPKSCKSEMKLSHSKNYCNELKLFKR